jgi:predicted HTH transcriptional regulator
MIAKTPASERDLARLLKPGEGPNLEFKRSTGELREGLQTICAFLNGSGGIVLFGVRPDGQPEGQQVSDQTFRASIVAAGAGTVPPGGREKMTEKTPGRILSVLTDYPEATIADLAAVIGVSDSTIERNLKALQGQNRIRRIGPDKGGRWGVVS